MAEIRRLVAGGSLGNIVTVTADHGDCFGEDGFVGHGEVWNSKVLEVPFVEGPISG